ncbi:MAG: SGNH/GDSL hydrolase family protein, partial [bacterium]
MNKTVSNAIALSLSLLIVLASLEVLFWLGARGVFNKTKLLNVLYNRPFSAFQAEQVYSGKFEAAIKKLEKKEKRKKKNKAGWDRTNRITTEKTVAGEVTYTYNNQGIRGAKIFSLDTAPGITRIAAFGDSFIFGQCVSDDEYWAPFLTESFKGKTEVLNFGVNGYGTDQAFIKYREKGVKFKPDIVMIGLYLENVLRNV